MILYLREIPKEGRKLVLNEFTGELTESLKDIVGALPYRLEADIIPMGESYDIRGEIQTSSEQTCSFCADTFWLPIKEKFHEMILGEDQKTLSGFDENWLHEDVHVLDLENPYEFNFGELIHEVVALAIPSQPECQKNCKGLCPECGENRNEEDCHCAEQKKLEESPFSVLKSVNLN